MLVQELELGADAPTATQSHSWVAQPPEPVVMATQGAHARSPWH